MLPPVADGPHQARDAVGIEDLDEQLLADPMCLVVEGMDGAVSEEDVRHDARRRSMASHAGDVRERLHAHRPGDEQGR
ncbi:hypothetical protein [Nostocoides japonicum]|uniref:hypothetical protein n=1 Tax=Nostocoides japonicum TaxID=99481 RepID=UPI00138F76FA|nr:hypothetical protein [Tetrasphaera japonica]